MKCDDSASFMVLLTINTIAYANVALLYGFVAGFCCCLFYLFVCFLLFFFKY